MTIAILALAEACPPSWAVLEDGTVGVSCRQSRLETES